MMASISYLLYSHSPSCALQVRPSLIALLLLLLGDQEELCCRPPQPRPVRPRVEQPRQPPPGLGLPARARPGHDGPQPGHVLVTVGVGQGPGGNCMEIGLPGKSILGDYFEENRTSRRPFLLLRISFPGEDLSLYNSSLSISAMAALTRSAPPPLTPRTHRA